MCVRRLSNFLARYLVFRQVFGYIFSEDVDVVRLVSKVMPLVASFQVGNSASCVYAVYTPIISTHR